MTDRLERLETELSGMRPRPLPGELIERIERGIESAPPADQQHRQGGRRWADRFLLATMSSGAIAACIIGVILLGEATRPSRQQSTPSSPFVHPGDSPRFGDSLLAVARATADPGWGEATNP